jgi:dUTP pyrophosphatase
MRLLKYVTIAPLSFSIIIFGTMNTITVNIVNNSTNSLPAYETSGSAGMDIKANLDRPLLLHPGERALVPTGLFIELPEGYEAQIRPRSGLAIKRGITCLNTPGTIDSDYRGEIKIILINLSNEIQEINHADRIAQIIIAKTERAALNVVQQLNETKRGTGGFGHTGTN